LARKHKIELVPATVEHAHILGQNLRDADLEEIRATTILSGRQVLRNAVACSDMATTGLVDGCPVFMFGTRRASILYNVGTPWMLGSDLLVKHQIEFLRRGQDIVEQMRAPYKFLENHVDCRNKMSIKWLEWLGFEIHSSKPFGLNKEPFHRFTMKGKLYV